MHLIPEDGCGNSVTSGGEKKYVSPIEAQLDTMHKLAITTTEDGIVKAVWNMGFTVDKEQLSLALQQDRKRYETAYEKGWNDCKQYYEEKMKQISELVNGSD